MKGTDPLLKLSKSKKYRDARTMLDSWKTALRTADAKTMSKIIQEKKAFFLQMRKTEPLLYLVFQNDAKELTEIAYEKLTGKDIIID